MKKLFANFFRRNLAFFRIGIVTNLEYRVNFLTDALVQPVVTTVIELILWIAIFSSQTQNEIAGFPRASYLSYAMWAAFIGRITVNWMYEFRMIDEIDSGSINSILSRPVSFFEYYWSQFFGYKLVTTAASFVFPIAIDIIFTTTSNPSRLPLALVLVFYYLFFVYILSVLITSLAFFFNRVHSITTAKNLILWLLAGELFPLDLLPEPWRPIIIGLPFSSGVYLPVGYITGRVTLEQVEAGFGSVTTGILFLTVPTLILWKAGVRRYAGTGA